MNAKWLKIIATICLTYLVVSTFWVDESVNVDSSSFVSSDAGSNYFLDSVRYTTEVITDGLDYPWDIAFTSNNRILVSEFDGRILEIVDGTLDSQPLIRLAEVSSANLVGLMGLTIDPDYEETKRLYACYGYEKMNKLVAKVVSLKDQSSLITLERVILDDIPISAERSSCAVRFGHDRKLYVTTGDANNPNLAQDLSSLAGKILRLNADGTVPSDNPFPRSLVYSYGHGDPRGIGWHPNSGVMYGTEAGPNDLDAGDEVNHLVKGYNYGWPEIRFSETKEGMVTAPIVFEFEVTPTNVDFYSHELIPQFKNTMFFGSRGGQGIYRVVFSQENPQSVMLRENMISNVGIVQALRVSPEGYIYFTSATDDENPTRLLRVVPGK